MPNDIAKKSILEADISFGGVTLTDKAVLAKHLAVMLKSGLTIAEALDIVASQAKGKFKKILLSILKSVESGNSLSSSLAKFPQVFSSLFVNTTLAGEASGNLEKNLDNVAEQLKKEKELVSKIKGAMIYPVVVMAGAAVLGLVMAFLVLPKIIPLFEGLKMDLPFTTRALIWVSHVIEDHGQAIFFGLVALVALFYWLVKQPFSRPATHLFFLKFPIIKTITKNSNLANFCRTLGTLLKSGLNIDEALEITKDTVSNHYYKKSLARISVRVKQGTKLSDNLAEYEHLFPRLVTSMIKVGEKSGNLEETLFYLAEFYDSEVDIATKSLSTAIEPILLIVIGLAVGGLAISIITPIYKITGNIQK